MSERALKEFREAMERRSNNRFTIELDCPPGNPRPSDLITSVIEGTNLPDRDPISKVFGQWTWDYSDINEIDKLWPSIQNVIKPRIQELYFRGVIRFGSW